MSVDPRDNDTIRQDGDPDAVDAANRVAADSDAAGGAVSRRSVLAGIGAGAIGAGAALGLAGAPRLTFADGHVSGGKRLVILHVRGGLDSLALLPPVGDPDYADQRGPLAFPEAGKINGPIDLDGRFALHPAATPLLKFWLRGQIAIMPAIASPYRGRNHGAAQLYLAQGRDVRAEREALEKERERLARAGNGAVGTSVGTAAGSTEIRDEIDESGWLGRALRGPKIAAGLPDAGSNSPSALGSATRLSGSRMSGAAILRGAPNVVPFNPIARPSRVFGYRERLDLLFRDSPDMAEIWQRALLEEAAMNEGLGNDDRRADGGAPHFTTLRYYTHFAGRMLASEKGPRVAVIEVGDFDTHADQGVLTGKLSRRLAALSDNIVILADALGPIWQDSLVLVVSEFGRSVRPNGRRGTDNGVGGIALAIGGGIAKPGIVGPWPGLADDKLLDGAALSPSLDLMGLFGAAMSQHMGLPVSSVLGDMFPATTPIAPFDGMFE